MPTPHDRPGGPAHLSLPSEREIRMERVFDAPRELVWRAFTEPQLIAQWYCRGNFVVVERFEPVKGGHWRLVEHSAEGIHGFEDLGDGRTRLVLTSSFHHEVERDGMLASGMEGGMHQSFDALDRLLARGV